MDGAGATSGAGASDDAKAAAAAAGSSEPAEPPTPDSEPTAIIIIGMAGAGKTTLMQRLNAHLHQEKTPYYMVNLDPAVMETPYGANVDIRDTVNYREVMKQYSLGPNGGILTALNLFATRFEQVLGLIDRRVKQPAAAAAAAKAAGKSPAEAASSGGGGLKYALFDTPGQIEIFTWSASGQIITESLAASYPTVVVYVVDTVRCKNATTFMSNMLYACSILYKLRLPLVLAFNKVDAQECDFAHQWMSDLDAFTEALQQERSYMGSLAQSMALMLEEFYRTLTAVGVSALSGEGISEFFVAIDKARAEYDSTYKVELREKREAKEKAEALRIAKEEAKMREDGLEAAGASVVLDGTSAREPGSVGGPEKLLGGVDRGQYRSGDDADASEEDDDREDDESDDDGENPIGYAGAMADRVGYTAADEKWAKENPDVAADREEYESLMRYLQKQKVSGGGGGSSGYSAGDDQALPSVSEE